MATTKPKARAKPRPPTTDPGDFSLWLCAPGFVVYPSIRPPHTVEPGDTRTIQVRARRKEYLDGFREFCPDLGPNLHFPHQHDYPHKAYCSPQQLAEAMAAMALRVDATKFKPHAKTPELHGCYENMWVSQLRYLSDGTSSYDRRRRPAECKRYGEHLWPELLATPKPGDGQECGDCGCQRTYYSDGQWRVTNYPPGSVKL